MPPPAPERAYLVLATPRSGSTLLCEMLGETGVAGRPLEHFEVFAQTSLPRQPREYFEGVEDPEILDLLPPLAPGTPAADPAADWWARILEAGTGPNGVWGGKLMWGHVEDLLARGRRLDGLADADLATLLQRLLGEATLIHVIREDTVAQAVSLWRAVQTQVWRGRADDEAVYRFAGIDHLRRGLEADERAWTAWLTEHRPDHHEVRYSELAADPAAVVAGALEAIGLPGDAVGSAPMERQGGRRSEDWAARYREERGA